jgi:hypothetical protein
VVVVEINQLVGEAIECEPHFVKAVSQLLIDVVQLAAARGRVTGNELEISPADFLVELQVGRTAPTPVLPRASKTSTAEEYLPWGALICAPWTMCRTATNISRAMAMPSSRACSLL